MTYDPKKKVEKMLKAIKKNATKIPKIRTLEQKIKYVEGCAKKMDNNPTGLEAKFIELLNELKIKFETQKILQYKIYDFYIPSVNTIIELDGSYWHGYGKTLDEMNDIQKRTYYNDRKKDILAKGLGYNIIRIWEHELDDEYYENTKERLRSELK